MQIGEEFHKSRRFHEGFIIVSYALLITLIAVAVVYDWQHSQVNSLNKKVKQLSAQVSLSKQERLLSIHGISGSPVPEGQRLPGTTTVQITQLNAKIAVPSYLNLTYNYHTDKSGTGYADLSSSELTSLSPNCTVNQAKDSASGSALGTIIRGNGTGTNSANEYVLKQYQHYYYAYEAPQGSCLTGNDPNAVAILVGQSSMLKNSLLSLVPINQ